MCIDVTLTCVLYEDLCIKHCLMVYVVVPVLSMYNDRSSLSYVSVYNVLGSSCCFDDVLHTLYYTFDVADSL